MFAFSREISAAVFLLNIAETEVKAAIDLADLEHSGGGSAAAFILLRDALARLRECRALPNVQALPDPPPYDKQYPPPNLTPCEVFTAGDGVGKADPPPVKLEIKDGNRRFNAALERGEIP